jgi:hypothetical protein
MSTKEILDKVTQTVDIAAVPLAAILGVWNDSIDWAVYTVATAGLVSCVCSYISLFLPKTK